MNKKFNVIQLNGIKGIFFILFLIGCAGVGFLVFPGWICMQVWNLVTSFLIDSPSMSLIHGVMLWCIIALVTYQLNKNNIGISFRTVSPAGEKVQKIMEEKQRSDLKSVLPIISDMTDNNKDKIKK